MRVIFRGLTHDRMENFPIWKQGLESISKIKKELEASFKGREQKDEDIILLRNIEMLGFLVNSRTVYFRLTYEDYRKLLDSMNCDVFKLLDTYGIELYRETQGFYHYVTMIITDCILFKYFILNERYEMFPT